MKDHPIPRVTAIHDLSGFGRAALCSIIPVLATMGIQPCPIPTAVLSTHSGGFSGYTFRDLTGDIPGIVGHWKALGLTVDGIYSGFLGSPAQVELVREIIRTFRTPDTWVVVDPVMGDNGALYSSIKEGMIAEMRRLIGEADLIVPNQTEAALLLGEDPAAPVTTAAALKARLRALSDLGPDTVLITSAVDEARPDQIGVAAYQRSTGRYWRVFSRRLAGSYPGTGDIFASVLLGSLLHGDSLPIAIDRAVGFISQCIKASDSYVYPHRDGVLLERELGLLRTPGLIGSYEEF